MTTRTKVFHPGYDSPMGYNKSSDFLFSDDIEKWIRTKKISGNRKYKEQRKRK